jgi:hypothetical protein
MKKVVVVFFIVYFWIYALANAWSNANANEYTEAVIGHVITETITGNMDHSKVMEQELEKLAHKFAIDSIIILQKYLPSVLEGIAADLRLQADEKYKCELLEGSSNGCI